MKIKSAVKCLSLFAFGLLTATNAHAVKVCQSAPGLSTTTLELDVPFTMYIRYGGYNGGNVAMALGPNNSSLGYLPIGTPASSDPCGAILSVNVVKRKPSGGQCFDPTGSTYAFAAGSEQNPDHSGNYLSGRKSVEFKNSKTVVIDSLSPVSGEAGSTFTVNGNYFSEGSTVYFGDVKAQTSFVSDTQLTAIVPTSAATDNITVRYETDDYSYCNTTNSTDVFEVTIPDIDSDGMPDGFESQYGLNPNDPSDAALDADSDGMNNLSEYLSNTNPNVKDNDVMGNPRFLAKQAYVDILNRQATEQEIDNWVNRTTAATPVDLYQSLLDTARFRDFGFIGRVYLATLERSPDAGGLHFYQNSLQNGLLKVDMIAGFVASPEFTSKYGTLSNAEFIRQIYLNVLGREPDQEGFDSYLMQLNTFQLTRPQMILGFVDSPEYFNNQDNKQRANALSVIIAGQPLSDSKNTMYQQWLVEESNGASVVRALLSGNEYRSRMMANISSATDDTDLDAIPDGVEFSDGHDVNVKDNYVTSNDALFIKQMLRDMMIAASTPELDAHMTALDLAGTRALWVEQLLEHTIIKTRHQAVVRLYNAFFLRSPELGGLQYWIDKSASGSSLIAIADSFAVSEEFVTRYGTLSNGAFVNLVYTNVLGRPADEDGLAYWTQKLDAGTSRGEVMTGFSESQEYKNLSINRDKTILLINLLFQRNITDGELTYWQDQLANGTAVSVLANAIMSSNQYIGRFN